MSEFFSYKKLEVWKRAHQLVLLVYEYTNTFPKSEIFTLQSQIRRAAVSVPSNIVEGIKRSSNVEKLRFINIAQASLSELDYQLFLSQELGYGNCEKLLQEAEEIAKMLSSFYNSISNRKP